MQFQPISEEARARGVFSEPSQFEPTSSCSTADITTYGRAKTRSNTETAEHHLRQEPGTVCETTSLGTAI
jgi:hypothetical protein